MAKARANAKTGANTKVTYAPFEAANYLDSEEAIAEYLSLAARDKNPNVLLKAISDVAKARCGGQDNGSHRFNSSIDQD